MNVEKACLNLTCRGEYLGVSEAELIEFLLSNGKQESSQGVEMKEMNQGMNMVGTRYFNQTVDTVSRIQDPDSIWIILSKRDSEDSDFSGSIILIKLDSEGEKKPTIISVDDCFVNEIEFEASWRTSNMTFFDMREIFDHELLDAVESFTNAIKSCTDQVDVLNKRNDFLRTLSFIFGTRLDKKEEEKVDLLKEIGVLKASLMDLKSKYNVENNSESGS